MIKVNDLLNHYNLGELSGDEFFHASGITDKNIRVWLPQVNINDDWLNIVLDNYGVIFQLDLKNRSIDIQSLIWDPYVVITRDKSKASHKFLADKYRPVYIDTSLFLIVHAKDAPQIAGGKPSIAGDIAWLTSFAGTFDEAVKKACLIWKNATKEVNAQRV